MAGIFGADRQIAACVAFAQITDDHDHLTFAATLLRGFAGVTLVSVGVYDLVLDAGMTGPSQDTADMVVEAVAATGGFNVTRVWTSPTTLRIRVWNGGFLDNGGFDVKVYRATNHTP